MSQRDLSGGGRRAQRDTKPPATYKTFEAYRTPSLSSQHPKYLCHRNSAPPCTCSSSYAIFLVPDKSIRNFKLRPDSTDLPLPDFSHTQHLPHHPLETPCCSNKSNNPPSANDNSLNKPRRPDSISSKLSISFASAKNKLLTFVSYNNDSNNNDREGELTLAPRPTSPPLTHSSSLTLSRWNNPSARASSLTTSRRLTNSRHRTNNSWRTHSRWNKLYS